MIHPIAPTLPVAIGLLALGAILLILHHRIALFWSKLYRRPVPTGGFYFYRYVLGPILILIVGLLALMSVLLIR